MEVYIVMIDEPKMSCSVVIGVHTNLKAAKKCRKAWKKEYAASGLPLKPYINKWEALDRFDKNFLIGDNFPRGERV